MWVEIDVCKAVPVGGRPRAGGSYAAPALQICKIPARGLPRVATKSRTRPFSRWQRVGRRRLKIGNRAFRLAFPNSLFSFATSAPMPEAPLGRGRADIHIGKGVFVRFCFDGLESRKFTDKSRTKQQRTSYVVYYIQPSLSSGGMPPSVGGEGALYSHTGVGLSALLVSTCRAMREPQFVERVTNRLRAFSYVCKPTTIDIRSGWSRWTQMQLMTTTTCPDCGAVYAASERSCPTCGCPNDNFQPQKEELRPQATEGAVNACGDDFNENGQYSPFSPTSWVFSTPWPLSKYPERGMFGEAHP